MVILHAFLALVAGFAATVLLATIAGALLGRLVPGWSPQESHPGTSAVIVNTGSTFLSAAAGGYLTAWVAAANPLIHVLALGMAVLALSALSALQSRDKQPVAYLLAMVAVTPLGVLAGGLVRLRVLGIL